VFASARSAAFFLILNGLMLFGAEALRRRAPGVDEGEDDGDHRIAHRARWRHAVGVGASQAIALIPGFSRSGASMGGGLLVGFSNEDAARFAFLLATPIIGAAAILKIPVLLGSDGNGVRGPAVVASLCSAATAYVSIRFLMRYFETNRLTPFAVFCFVEGIVLSMEPGEGEAGEPDQERGDAVLHVHGRDAALVPEEVRQRQRLGRDGPVHDGDRDEGDPGDDAEDDECALAVHGPSIRSEIGPTLGRRWRRPVPGTGRTVPGTGSLWAYAGRSEPVR
jgi:hypothetical protein